jgi:hypothetical protein
MINPEELVEHREYERYQVREGAFVLLGPDSTKLGRIVDVSVGGLAFSHMARTSPSSELFELDMFLIDSDFYLNSMPYEVISDFKTYNNPFSSISMRRCGVKFGALSNSQIFQLEHFIQTYTFAEALVFPPA